MPLRIRVAVDAVDVYAGGGILCVTNHGLVERAQRAVFRAEDHRELHAGHII